ncbi:MAG TPA: CpsD/CapB family tyrosine-protein kinase [Gammaproteobacteria bacterium]|nr:CpsD/CapB family tyrosine-protein kinase [Gammaproteobacteria bacterium]
MAKTARMAEQEYSGRSTPLVVPDGSLDGVPEPLRRNGPQTDLRCVSLVAPESYESGRYQQLRSTIERKEPDGRAVVLAVTSPSAGDGKTLTAINLAGAFAHNSQFRVLIVDVDMRRASETMGRYFGLPAEGQAGLTDVLHRPESGLHPTLQVRGLPNFSVLLRGRRDAHAYEMLASERFGEFVERVRAYYHYVILDAPPILPVPDNSAISRWIDGFLLVVTANRTPREALAEAMRSIGEDKLKGIVLNRCEPLAKRYYSYYGRYGGRRRGYHANAFRAGDPQTLYESPAWPPQQGGVEIERR